MFAHKKGLTQHQISVNIREVMRDDATSQATIFRWTAELQHGRQSTEN